MSGPMTAGIVVDPVAVLLSATAIRAAQVVAQGYADAEELRGEQQRQREQRNEGRNAAARAGHAMRQQAVADINAEFDTLVESASRYADLEQLQATRPAQPDPTDEQQLSAYVSAMQALIAELRTMLLTESALHLDDAVGEPGLDASLLEEVADTSATAVQQLLERVAHLGPSPADITCSGDARAFSPSDRISRRAGSRASASPRCVATCCACRRATAWKGWPRCRRWAPSAGVSDLCSAITCSDSRRWTSHSSTSGSRSSPISACATAGSTPPSGT